MIYTHSTQSLLKQCHPGVVRCHGSENGWIKFFSTMNMNIIQINDDEIFHKKGIFFLIYNICVLSLYFCHYNNICPYRWYFS